MKVKAVFIDVLNTKDVDIREFESDDNHAIHELLNDSFFDVFYFRLTGYDETLLAFVDDCGRIKGLPLSAVYNDRKTVALVGNIVICRPTADGDIESITREDVEAICENLATATCLETSESYPVLTNLEMRGWN